jgi:TPR repeat protein
VVERDFDKAFKWCKKAGEAGITEGFRRIGEMYED